MTVPGGSSSEASGFPAAQETPVVLRMLAHPGLANPLAPHGALLLVQLFFGSLPVMGKVVLRHVPAMALVGFRVVGGALLLLLCARLVRAPRITAFKDWSMLLVLALLGVFFNQILYIEGLARTTALNAAVLTTTIPVITTVLSILMGQEKYGWLKGAGIALSLVGALRVLGVDELSLANEHLVGNLFILGNTISYSLYLVLARTLLSKYESLSVITPIFLISSVLLLPLALPAWGQIEVSTVPPLAWGLALCIVLFPTVGAYLLNIWALKRTKPSVVVVYIYLQPLVATFLSTMLLGEALTVRLMVSALLVFAGVYLVGRARAREA